MQYRTTLTILASSLLFAMPVTGAVGESAVETPAKPAAKKSSEDYLRLTRDAQKRPVALEVAITHFASKDPQQKDLAVDLVGAVHIAEKSYYTQLNREFRNYDVVLYELVAPEGTKIPKGGRKGKGGNPLSAVQTAMKDLLELEFQLDQVDYTRKNFVHADMSPEQMSKSMKDRGESFSAMLLRAMGYAMAKQADGSGNTGEMQILMALFDKNRALALKRIMAEQFQEMDGTLNALEGPNGGTLISERNKTALEVLGKQLAAGKHKIAIFYGAGHMADMAKRLEKDFHLVPVKTRWLVAWDLKGGKK
jgi:hypothetical protein